MSQKKSMQVTSVLLLSALSGTAGASGFALQNQTGSGNGNAFAGAAAAADDAGTVYFNPAGMSYMPQGHTIALSGTLLKRSIRYDDKGSTTVNPTFFPLPQGSGGDGGGVGLLPALYWVYGISPNLSVGLGIGPTFGNTTEYKVDFIGRNAGYFFEMEQININPSIAYRVNDRVSLGGGINLAYNKSHFKQGVPLVDPNGVLSGGLARFPAYNYLDVEADDWAVGYNLGAMFQVSPSTRVGLAYRSKLSFRLEGEEKYGTQVRAAGLVNQDVKGTLTTPANFSLAVAQKLSDRWELLGDATWTDWSVVDTLVVRNQDTGAPLQKLVYNFKDTWRFGLGANYQLSDALKLRFGVAYDHTPVRNAEDRTMTLPDSDRRWLSFGGRYAFSKKASLDFGYTHIFFDKAKTERAVTTGYPGAETLRQTIRGEFKASADILSLQYNHTF